jgi:EAL domain-containing protein (putative c-di-GMP-specific phosphodiesterase class I)
VLLETLPVAIEPVFMRSSQSDRCILGKDCPSFGGGAPRRRAADLDTEEARAEATDRRRLQLDLKHAIAAGAFVLHYQPRVALATGTIIGAEAVIRWPHRRRGLIPPDRFIPLAEQTGLIGAIGAWALRTGCAEAAAWGNDRLTLSLNISPRQLQDGGFLEQVATAAEATGLQTESIELELTEATLLAIDDDTLLLLSVLRDIGVGLALDDFGTGYASLAMLRRLPLTTLKIGRSLVRDLPDNREDAAIVQAMVTTMHAMGLAVVAEGVETEAQCAFLAGIGVDAAQGYLFGRPVPAQRLREQLAA